MRAIGFFIVALLVWPLYPGPGNSLYKFPGRSKIPVSFTLPAIDQPVGNIDTNQLKQSGWYSDAIKKIEESEYEIKPAGKNLFTSPNRGQNLRASYTGDKFILQTREEDDWKLELSVLGIYSGKKKIYSPRGNAIATIEKNKIQFAHDDEFTVEYINNKEGVRQNFIIKKEPVSKPKQITVKLQATRSWFVNQVHPKEIHFAKVHGEVIEKKLTYNDLKVWDANNKELDAFFSVNKNEVSINVNTADAVYPITIDPVSTTTNWMVESNLANALMGYSATSAGDVNGDGYSDVIVGAYTYDNGEYEEGVVFVYHGSATGLSTTPAAMRECNVISANLGFSVASAGDVNGDSYSDVIIGAIYYTNGQSTEGAAFVYHGSATGIDATPAAIVESNQASASMGSSVASAGDVNGDGYSDIIVGAFHYNNGQVSEGRVYVYHGSATGINTTAVTIVESDQVGAEMGFSVASAGDVNGDGFSDVVIGAVLYDNGQPDEGVAFVYHGSATGINSVAAAIVECNQASANLGHYVASAGDVNGDGYSDVIVGAWLFDNGESDEGVAFVYHGSSTGISTTAIEMLESNQTDARFGVSVACAGDVNGDGYSDVIVGARNYDNGQTNEGAAFVYYGSSSGISNTIGAMIESNQASAFFGVSVASAGDVNGDGYSDAIVGAYCYSNGQSLEGAAFVYHGSSSGINPVATSFMESNQLGGNMGGSVASAGDVNADGYSDVIVGAPLFDNGEMNEGVAFVFHGSASGINTTPAAMLQANQADARYGAAVASAGDVNGDGYSDVIVGAYYYDNGQTDEGAAFVYHGSASGISTVPSTTLQSDQASAFLGVSVSGAGDVNGDGYGDVIVGAYSYDNGQADEGAAFIYLGSNSGINATAITFTQSNQAGAYMGISVSAAGDVNGDGFGDVIVGAYSYDNGQTDEGAAFVYHGYSVGIITTPATTLECNQASAAMGVAVSSAGDVNGDGYGDVIVGAYNYSDPNTYEGAAFVYHGSASGIIATATATLECNQDLAEMGIAVSSAGDVNGDGYSDIAVGAHQYANGESDEGAVFIYHGSTTGINPVAASIIESNVTIAGLGVSVASAGDVNADGYSDVIAGAAGFFNVEFAEGAAFVYHGNSTGNNYRNNLRLYNSDLVTPIQQSNMNDPNLFGAGLFAKSFLGKQKGKLVYQTVKNGVAFTGSPITTSTAFTAQQPGFTDLGLNGVELKSQIAKQVPAKATYIRARVKYDLVTSITGQVYGPWRYPEGFLRGRRDVGSVALPVKFISFTAVKENGSSKLKWITSNEEPGVQFEVQHSIDGINFTNLGIVNGRNQPNNDYEWLHNSPAKGNNFYRIRAVENNKTVFSPVRILRFDDSFTTSIYPDPVKTGERLTIKNETITKDRTISISIFSMAGQAVWKKDMVAVMDGMILIDIPVIPGGLYLLQINAGQHVGKAKMIVENK